MRGSKAESREDEKGQKLFLLIHIRQTQNHFDNSAYFIRILLSLSAVELPECRKNFF